MLHAALACVIAAGGGWVLGRRLARLGGGVAEGDAPLRPMPTVLAILGAAALTTAACGWGLPEDATTPLVATLASQLAALGVAQGLGVPLLGGPSRPTTVGVGAVVGAGAALLVAWMHPGGGGARETPADLAHALLVAPALEEMLFRGALQHTLARRSPRGAIVVSAFVFAAAHPGGPDVRLPLLVLGLSAALARARTGAVLPAWAVHVAWNATMLAISQPDTPPP
jgi:membrane protease YdiL (CAAX protease family)